MLRKLSLLLSVCLSVSLLLVACGENNVAPAFTSDDLSFDVTEGDILEFEVDASDENTNDVLSFRVSEDSAVADWVALEDAGVGKVKVIVTVPDDASADSPVTFQLSVTDSAGVSATLDVTLSISAAEPENTAPVFEESSLTARVVAG